MTTTTLTFTQANGDASGWSSIGYPLPQVVGNRLEAPALDGTIYAGTYVAGLDMSSYGYVELTASQDLGTWAIYLRMDGGLSGYAWSWSTATGMELFRVDTGVGTAIDTASAPSTGSPHLFRLEAVGSTINGYVDGVLQASAVDATHSSGTGLFIAYFATTGATFSFADNFVFSNDAPPYGRRVVRPRYAVHRASLR